MTKTAVKIIKTDVDPGGLRYRSKASGSPFAVAGNFGTATMSCFLCGIHRPRNVLKSRKLLGKTQFVCAPSCKEARQEAAGRASIAAARLLDVPGDPTAQPAASA